MQERTRLASSPLMCRRQPSALVQTWESSSVTVAGSASCRGGEDLDHTISGEGMAADPKMTVAVQNWPTLRTVVELRVFLRLASYYQGFVKDFIGILKPLKHFTEDGTGYVDALSHHDLSLLLPGRGTGPAHCGAGCCLHSVKQWGSSRTSITSSSL